MNTPRPTLSPSARRLMVACDRVFGAAPVLCAPCWEYGYCQYPDNCHASIGEVVPIKFGIGVPVSSEAVKWDSRKDAA